MLDRTINAGWGTPLSHNNGDETSMEFAELYKVFHEPVKRFIWSMVKDEWAADDVLQETFLKVQTKLDTLKDPAKVKPWIFSIARNQCLDYFRKKSTKPQAPEEVIHRTADTEILPIQLELERQEMSQCVQDKMALLPEAHRSVLVLFDTMEFSHQEVADILEITPGAAKVRLHRARKAFKEILDAECDFEHDPRNVFVCVPKDKHH
jgi:RNA polymerase sigma-70 factor (ECF subfamily)